MRVLCVATHPDDEIIGVGGTLARHAAQGDESDADSYGQPGDANGRDAGAGTPRADDGDKVTDRLESLEYL